MLLTAAAAQSACAESVGQVVNEGNKLYRQGHYKEAVNEYDKAATQSPEVVEPRFNKADGYLRLDDLQQAIDLYKAVAAESRDMKLVEKAKYNLGNSFFQQGSKLKDSDLQKAVENMQTAIGWWRQVLDIDPANEKAAKNIEVARLTIKDIIDQINKQKQQQQQQQKQTQEDLKQLLEQQKSLADKTQQENQKPNPDYNDISKEQSQLKDRTEQVKQQMQQQNDPNNPDQKQQQAAEQLENAADKQKDAAEKLKKSDAAGGKQSQDEAAKDIEKALKSLSDQQNQQQKQQQEQQNNQQQNQQEPNQPQEPNQAQQQQQKQQAAAPDTTAEEILDKEQKQKEQRQMMQSPGFQKVDKDW